VGNLERAVLERRGAQVPLVRRAERRRAGQEAQAFPLAVQQQAGVPLPAELNRSLAAPAPVAGRQTVARQQRAARRAMAGAIVTRRVPPELLV